ncbi:MAG TPA: hypothetical protein VLM17_05845 [Xanthomonadaceae bacterium]|nr:hypothetical protein [Xanthomonadaceae bacterium]
MTQRVHRLDVDDVAAPRRAFLRASAGALALAVFGARPRAALAAVAPVDIAAALDACRVRRGPCKGAYALLPRAGVVWYFASLALRLAWDVDPALRGNTRAYLDLHLDRLRADYTIADVDDPSRDAGWREPDSHDAYAGTLLSLACEYAQRFGDMAWFARRAALLKDVAYANLAVPQKPGGLVGAFQRPGTPGYLMNNCEDWHGLQRLAQLLRQRGDGDAGYFALVADGVRAGIDGLFDPLARRWRAADVPLGGGFYPALACQVYPQAFGLPVDAARCDAGYAVLNAEAPGWENCDRDPYPWLALGAVAALRGDRIRASAQAACCDALASGDPARLTVNELGWLRLLRRTLG